MTSTSESRPQAPIGPACAAPLALPARVCAAPATRLSLTRAERPAR
jgi:hypothetical protein